MSESMSARSSLAEGTQGKALEDRQVGAMIEEAFGDVEQHPLVASSMKQKDLANRLAAVARIVNLAGVVGDVAELAGVEVLGRLGVEHQHVRVAIAWVSSDLDDDVGPYRRGGQRRGEAIAVRGGLSSWMKLRLVRGGDLEAGGSPENQRHARPQIGAENLADQSEAFTADRRAVGVVEAAQDPEKTPVFVKFRHASIRDANVVAVDEDSGKAAGLDEDAENLSIGGAAEKRRGWSERRSRRAGLGQKPMAAHQREEVVGELALLPLFSPEPRRGKPRRSGRVVLDESACDSRSPSNRRATAADQRYCSAAISSAASSQ